MIEIEKRLFDQILFKKVIFVFVSQYFTLFHHQAVGAPVETARELDDAVMHEATIVVDSYGGAQAESGDIILSKV